MAIDLPDERDRNRRAVEKRLGRQLELYELGGAAAVGWFEDIDAGARTADQVASLITRESRGGDAAYVPSLPRVQEAGVEVGIGSDDPTTQARADALGAHFFHLSESDSEVLSFRTHYLHDYERGFTENRHPVSLLSAREVEGWIEAQHDRAAARGEPVAWGQVSYLVRDTVKRRKVITQTLGQSANELGQLIGLADTLARRYAWSEAGATTYVLTGQRPRVLAGRVTLQVRQGRNGAATRVVLSVDPMTAPVEDERLYRQARNVIRPGGAKGRLRGPSEKRYRLAAFYADWPERDGVQVGTRAARARWNDIYPDWRYDDDTNFRNHARAAYRRIEQEAWAVPAVVQQHPLSRAGSLRATKARGSQ